MKRAILLLLGSLIAAGCRTTDPAVPMMEAELRWLEDQYYVLEDQYNHKCRQLESCRLAHMSARPHSGEPIPAGEREPQGDSSRRGRNGSGTSDGESLPPIPPEVEGLPADAFDLSPGPTPAGVTPSSYHHHAMDTQVTHIVLNRQLTGGFDRDRHAGDDGVLVVIEPRNRSGQFVPLTGEVTVRLIDLAGTTDEDRTVAHWRLSAQQASEKMRRSLLGRGLHLELPWPVAPPQHSDLKLEVIYTTVDGRKLRAEREITVDLPRELSARWTPIHPDGSPNIREQTPRIQTAALPSAPPRRPSPAPAPVINTTDAPRSWSPQR